ncbi:MAG: hypothetical protein V4683_15365 [Bacteroidota bacterium]
MDTLLPKFAISVACSIVFLILLFNKERILRLVKNSENIYFLLSLIVFRFIPILIVYLLLKFDATSDVKMFHTWAVTAKNGYFVYRDFYSPYAPLFSYITALPLFFYNHVNSILLLMVVIEVTILTITYRYFANLDSKSHSFYYSLLYLSLPATFVLSVISGQEDIWMWGIIICSLLIYQKTNDSFWVGTILGIGMIVTKVIFVFSLPIAFILLPKKLRLLVGLALIGIPTLCILVYFGGDTFLLPIQEANNPRTPNIWSILNPFLSVYSNIGIKNLNLIGLISNVTIIILLSLKSKIAQITFSKAFPLIWIFSNCWLMFIQQSSLSNYCFVFLMPIIFMFSAQKDLKFLIITLLFSVACTLQPPIWWGQKMPIYANLSDILKPINLVEYILEIFIVGCIIYFCKTIIHTLFSKKLDS